MAFQRSSLRRRPSSRRQHLRSATGRVRLEQLEHRQLFALLGVNLDLPIVTTQQGTQTYNASTLAFDASSIPVQFQVAPGQTVNIGNATGATRSTQVHINVNHSGGLVSGAAGDDLVVIGRVVVGNTTYNGVLLRGEILPGGAFGFSDTSAFFDFRFSVTGGLLAPNYFAGKDIGMVMQVENSTYLSNKFNASWSGVPKATIGPIASTTGSGPSLTSLAGHVYVDANNNGVRDEGEAPIPGTTVQAVGVNADGTFTTTTVTDADGAYLFANIPAGTYRINETQPAGYLDGIDVVGTVNGSPSGSVLPPDSLGNIGLPVNGVGVDYDFGEIGSSLSGYVYHDANNNGIKESGEAAIPGTTVTLTGKDFTGAIVNLTAVTDANGFYSFTGLRPADANGYTLTETQPSGYLDGKDTIGTPGGNTANDQFAAINLPVGFNGTNNNFGELRPSSISGYVYHDANNDGIKQTAESPIANVPVVLTGTNDLGQLVSLATTTNALGYYEFTGLRPGTYQLNETQPANYLDGKDTIGTPGGATTNDQFANITLPENYNGTNNNFGELLPASIAGNVYYDANNDGIFQSTESGIPNVTLTLTGTDDLGNLVSLTTTTSPTGAYSFDNLRPGTYQISEAQPAGYLDGKDTIGTPGGTTANDNFSSIVLTSGTAGANNNFGELLAASIAGNVYYDSNNDGLRAGETGISGATVTLTGTDDLGNAVSLTAITSPTGAYSFTNLRPGNYTLTESQPAGYLDGKDTIGTPGGTTSNDQFSSINLTAGTNGVENNFGELLAAQISGYVYYDANNNGIKESGEAAIPGTTVTLTGVSDLGQSVTFTTTTDSAGYYEFIALRPGTYTLTETQPSGYLDGKDTQGTPGNGVTGNDVFSAISIAAGTNGQNNNFGELLPASLGDRVWHDVNANGVQDAGEAGISGVLVTLRDAAGNTVATTTTDANGNYLFGDLAPGSYSVLFAPVAGYVRTGADAGANDAADSDANASTGATGLYTLTAGQYNDTVDAGYYKLASLGNFVWLDANRNGIQDNGEPGVAGVTVTLSNGATTTTNSSGYYIFSNLVPGSYSVTFSAPNYYYFTTADAGANDAADSDANVATGQTASYTLVSGQYNDTVDAGLYTVTSAVSIKKYVNPLLGPSSGGEGLTPGYWKQSQHFDQWYNYVPTGASATNYNAVFGLTASQDDSSMTLLAALGRGGGGKAALGRHAAAALLNAANPNVSYAYTTAQIIAMVKNAYLTGDYENTKNQLAVENEKEADLTPGSTSGSTPQVGYGYDADTLATAPSVYIGSQVIFTLVVTNPGETSLTNVLVRDDNATPTNLADDFSPTATLGTDGIHNIGDEGNDGILGPGEVWIYTYVKSVSTAGTFTNTATVTGTPAAGNPAPVSDADIAIYAGQSYGVSNSGSLSGYAYVDANGNGVKDAGEAGIPGVYMTLNGTYGTTTFTLYRITDANGYYLFDNLPTTGTYSITEAQPAGYIDGKDSAGSLGGSVAALGSDAITNITVKSSQNGTNYNFGEVLPASLTGLVYTDNNNDGDVDNGETGIANVKVTLTGKDIFGRAVSITDYTDANGIYEFANLYPSDSAGYTITETQPSGYTDGKDTLGTINNLTVGTASNDKFSAVVIRSGQDGVNYNFGEIKSGGTTTTTTVGTGMTATIGFWQNKNGQALIKSLNGSASCTKLGNWLASEFPNLFGTGGPTNLAGYSNTQIASSFQQVFKVTGMKVQAQTLAVALASYVTDATLAGGTFAASYGFKVNSTGGTGAATYNVGSYGSAAGGLTNNTSYTVMALLKQANTQSIFSASTSIQTAWNSIFDGINQKGDIL